MFKSMQKAFADERKQREESDETPEDTADDSVAPATDYIAEVLTILRRLPPSGFEKLCQNLLRESGFQQVTVTGKSGDGGIDTNQRFSWGHGWACRQGTGDYNWNIHC